METGMCYLVPKEQMDRIIAQLDRIEAQIGRRPDPPPVIGAVLSAKAMADRLGVTTDTLYRWAREGTIRSIRVGGRVLFPESAAMDLMKGGKDERGVDGDTGYTAGTAGD